MTAKTCCAVLMDTISIRKYVFASNILRDNLGASHIVKSLFYNHDVKGQEEARALLVLAGLNLKRAGSGRNRGWGEVSCRLYSDDNEDLGQKYLNQLKQWDKTKQHKMTERKMNLVFNRQL